MMIKKLFIASSTAFLLASCAAPSITNVNEKIDTRAVDAENLLTQARRGQGAVRQEERSPVETVADMWLPVRKASDINAQLNKKDLSSRRVAFNMDFHTIQEVAERVTLATGIPLNVSPDAMLPLGADPANPAAAAPVAAALGAGTALPPLPALPGALPGGPGMNMGVLGMRPPVRLVYDGPLPGFLDVAAARFGVSWEWEGSSVQIYRYKTKTFRIVALPGDSSLQNTISNTTGQAGDASGQTTSSTSAGGGATSTSGVSFSNLSVWTALKDAISGMLSLRGNVTVTPATGTVTVTDTPQIVARVEQFIDGQNASLAKQVVVNVRVLAVDLNDYDQYGINWNAVYNQLSGNFGLGLTNAFTVNPNASQLALKVLGTPGAAGPGSADIKAWAGSQAIISALSSQGRVSQITSASLTTLNNQPAPLQVGRQTSYLASSTTTLTQGAGATTTLTPGMVTTGFSMSVVPHMLDRGRLMMQFAINISSLLALTPIQSGNSTIQTPDIDTRNFLQRVMVGSGDTLVLTGFEQANLDGRQQGVGSAQNYALGGGSTAGKVRSILVILLQPVVVGDL